jgi:hypothetical protein
MKKDLVWFDSNNLHPFVSRSGYRSIDAGPQVSVAPSHQTSGQTLPGEAFFYNPNNNTTMQTITNKKPRTFTFTDFVIVLTITLGAFTFLVYCMSFWTERSIECWLEHDGKIGVDADCGRGVAMLASILLPLVLLFNIVTEVIRLFW